MEDNVQSPVVTKVPKKPKAQRISKKAGVNVTTEKTSDIETVDDQAESATTMKTESSLQLVEQTTTESGFIPSTEKAPKTVIFDETKSSATESTEKRKKKRAVKLDKQIGVSDMILYSILELEHTELLILVGYSPSLKHTKATLSLFLSLQERRLVHDVDKMYGFFSPLLSVHVIEPRLVNILCVTPLSVPATG